MVIKMSEETNNISAYMKWGVVKKLEVEADTRQSLLAAIEITQSYHHFVTHYEFNESENALYLLSSTYNFPNAVPLPFKMTVPSSIMTFIWEWLQQATMPPTPNTDGSYKRGYNVSSTNYGGAFLVVRPVWVVYSK